jgi:capsular polysaccharide export protein
MVWCGVLKMISNGLNEFKGKRVLMLQGPVGPFFARFATDLALAGAVVFKVNFNGGDWLFSRSRFFTRVFDFTQDLKAWPDYFDDLLGRLNIDTVFLFGDCRPVHVAALAVIQRRDIQVGVFEEGYLRPDYITLERDGVNSNSSLPSNPKFYLDQPAREFAQTEPLGSTYGQAAKWGMLYFAATSVGRFKFRSYQHHRRIGFSDGPSWVLSFLRKQRYRFSEAHVLPRLVNANSGNFFLVSLQTRGDAQMSVHSAFDSVDQFIDHVMSSFARHAPAGRLLALKHHPLDRGYSDYSALIERLKVRYHLQDRCYYIHDQHLPLLLQHTCGVVVVNSTAGLSAVGEGVPVMACGEAIYDLQGLTFQGSLNDFWKHAHLAVPNARLFDAFRSYLISHTQHRGSFYKPLPGVSFQSGVIWADHGATAPHHDEQDAQQRARRAKTSQGLNDTP